MTADECQLTGLFVCSRYRNRAILGQQASSSSGSNSPSPSSSSSSNASSSCSSGGSAVCSPTVSATVSITWARGCQVSLAKFLSLSTQNQNIDPGGKGVPSGAVQSAPEESEISLPRNLRFTFPFFFFVLKEKLVRSLCGRFSSFACVACRLLHFF